MSVLAAPLGLVARYFGRAGGTTSFFYWVQAIYPDGFSPLSNAVSVTSCQAALSLLDRVQLTWNPTPGAIGYNLFGNSSSTIPQAGLVLLTTLGPETGFSDITGPTYLQATVVYPGMFVARARYTFATDGGAISTITPADSDTIPANAVLCGGYCNSTIAFVGASGTIGIGTSAGSSATSIMAQLAITSLTLDAVIPLLGTNPIAATNKVLIKLTAAGRITMTIATTIQTAGELEIVVFYFIGSKS